MKRVKYALLVSLAIITIRVYGDIIYTSYSPVKVCVKIENLEDYPDIEIVGLSNCLAIFSKPKANIINSNSRLEVQRACPLTFYAVKKDYLKEKGIENINWKNDKNVRKSDETVIAKKIRVYYQNVETLEINFVVAGFNENSMVMFKTSETNKFNDGKPDLVHNFSNPMNYPQNPELQKLQKTF